MINNNKQINSYCKSWLEGSSTVAKRGRKLNYRLLNCKWMENDHTHLQHHFLLVFAGAQGFPFFPKWPLSETALFIKLHACASSLLVWTIRRVVAGCQGRGRICWNCSKPQGTVPTPNMVNIFLKGLFSWDSKLLPKNCEHNPFLKRKDSSSVLFSVLLYCQGIWH